MKNLLCAILGHRMRDTGNRLGQDPVLTCMRCRRVWAGADEILAKPPERPWDNPWNRAP